MKCQYQLIFHYAVFVLSEAASQDSPFIGYKDFALSCIFCYQKEVSDFPLKRSNLRCDAHLRLQCQNDFRTFLACENQRVCEEVLGVSRSKEFGKSLMVRKRTALGVQELKKDDLDMASIPWQTLWLLQSTTSNCVFPEEIIKFARGSKDLEVAEWIRPRPQEPIGTCPVRFRPIIDPHRWLPRNMVGAECVCEGSPCARRGLHVCVTVYATRNFFSLVFGRRKMLLPVGCLCAIQKMRLATSIIPKTVD